MPLPALAFAAALAATAIAGQAGVDVDTAISETFPGSATDADVVAAWGGNPILPGNLAQDATITLDAGSIRFGVRNSVANLNDGLMVSNASPFEPGGPYTVEDTSNSFDTDNGDAPSQVTLVLDGTYDLARIEVFTTYQWTRTGQKWDVYTSTDGGSTWSAKPLASADVPNMNEFNNKLFYSRRVTVSGSGSAAIATGVNALRFDIHNTSGADGDVGGHAAAIFSEIAVYPVVPAAQRSSR